MLEECDSPAAFGERQAGKTLMNAERENITEEKIEIIATVTGLVRVSSTKQGLQFWVEYNGRRKTDARYYQDRDSMMSIARILLREMTQSDIGTNPIKSPARKAKRQLAW
jgi:hypothetical protein